jgi:hypothetical protein
MPLLWQILLPAKAEIGTSRRFESISFGVKMIQSNRAQI